MDITLKNNKGIIRIFINLKTWGVRRRCSSTNPELELYLMYSPSMKCSRWNSGLPGLSGNSSTYIWKMSTCQHRKQNYILTNRKTLENPSALLDIILYFIPVSHSLISFHMFIIISFPSSSSHHRSICAFIMPIIVYFL